MIILTDFHFTWYRLGVYFLVGSVHPSAVSPSGRPVVKFPAVPLEEWYSHTCLCCRHRWWHHTAHGTSTSLLPVVQLLKKLLVSKLYFSTSYQTEIHWTSNHLQKMQMWPLNLLKSLFIIKLYTIILYQYFSMLFLVEDGIYF